MGPKREELVRPKRNRPVSVQTRATACLRLFSPIQGVSKRRGKSTHPGNKRRSFSFFFLSFPTKHAAVIAILNERIRFSFLSFFSSILWFRRLSRGIFFSREEKMPRDVIRRRAKGTNFFLSLVDIYSCKMGSIRAISI